MSISLIGHTRLQALLAQAVVRRRVPQALLFAGPSGVGKRTAAVALAQAVNCLAATGGVACGRCSACQRIARGQFSDVVLIDRADAASISIKPVRERILDLVGYRPFEGQQRVFIIDGADDLTVQAQDALLKTLEEPPPSALLMLITVTPDALRPTILSRCRRLRFGVLSDDEVATVLVERLGMDAASARSRAAVAGGSIGQALAVDGGTLEVDRESALALLESSASASVPQRLKVAAAFAKHGSKRRDREALAMRLAHLSSLLRDLGTVATGAPDTVTLANPDAADVLTRVARAQHVLDRNASPKIVADWVAMGI